MENLLKLLNHPIAIGVIVALASTLITYYLGIKKNRKKITNALYLNFQEDNEKFRRELIEEKDRAKVLVAELQAQKSTLEETIKFYKSEYSELTRKYVETEKHLRDIKVKYDALEVELRNIRKELTQTEKERDEIKEQFIKVDANYKSAREEIKKLQSIINNLKKRSDRNEADKKKNSQRKK